MKRLLFLLFLAPALALAQLMPPGAPFALSNTGNNIPGSGPYSPSTFTANALLYGNGSGPILSSGSTTDANGNINIPSTATNGLKIYNTADQTTNYERLEAIWSSNIAIVRTVAGGSGVVRTLRLGDPNNNNMVLVANGSTSGQAQLNLTANSLASNIGVLIETGVWSQTSGTNAFLSITPNYNQVSGNAANTDILLNRTQTAVGSGAQNLMDLQVTSVSKFLVSNVGALTIAGSLIANGGNISFTNWFNLSSSLVATISSGTNVAFSGFLVCGAGSLYGNNGRGGFSNPSDGVITARNDAGTDFTRLQLGGTTSSFPAIKRSAATLAFRLADDSADAGISSGTVISSGNFVGNNGAQFQNSSGTEALVTNSGSVVIKSNNATFATFNGTAGTTTLVGATLTLGTSSVFQLSTSGGTAYTAMRSAGANGTDVGSIATDTGALRLYSNQNIAATFDANRRLALTPGALSTGATTYYLITVPADAGLTTATEAIGEKHATGTRTWVDGTVALQRERFFEGVTYAKTTTSAIFTDAFSVYITPNAAAAGVTITRNHSLGIVDGNAAASSITGGLVVSTTVGTTATSVGIGGGNIYAGGNIVITGSGTFGGGLFVNNSNVTFGQKIINYNNIVTAGWGVPAIYSAGRVTAQSAANSSIATYTCGAADGSFDVSANMNVTVSTALVTTLTCTYTDESNTARTMILPVQQLSGSFIAAGAITGTGAWETPTMHIRVKASTAITILTSAGTFTGVTYTAEGLIIQTG